MNLSDLSSTVLTYIVTYGAYAVGAVVLLTAIGLPLPSTFCVVASGAFIQQGVLELPATAVAAFAGAVVGDTLSYGIGRTLRGPLLSRYGQTAAWRNAERYFGQRGALAVFLTRCVLTPLALPVNLIAGSSRYALRRFVGIAAVGELVWLVGYGTLGYAFGSQWEYASDLISNFSGLLVGLLLLGAGGYALFRWAQPQRHRGTESN